MTTREQSEKAIRDFFSESISQIDVNGKTYFYVPYIAEIKEDGTLGRIPNFELNPTPLGLRMAILNEEL